MQIQLPENINLAYPERFILTIEVHPRRIVLSVYNPADNGSYFFHSAGCGKPSTPDALLKEIYFDNEYLALPFRKVNILNYTPVFTYVPSLIFEEKDKEKYMDFLFMKEKGKLLHQPIEQQGLTVIHEIDEEIYKFIERSFTNARYIHHTYPLLCYFQNRIRTVNASRMIVNINTNEIDILCFSRDTFLLGNHFECKTGKDMIYYILFTWKQFQFDQTKDFIYLAGNQEIRRELMDELKEYVHNIIPVNITPEDHFEQIDTGKIPFELASLSLCEL